MPRVPTGIAAFYEIVDTFQVRAVRIVVRCEEIAVIIPGQLLRIAQPVIEKLHVRTVRIAAENRPLVGAVIAYAFFRRKAVSTIA